MLEVTGNIWNTKTADAICITTNGFVKRNGEAVMGAGVALQARDKYPGIALEFGNKINAFGNHVQVIHIDEGPDWFIQIVSFPVKHHWKEKASPGLIQRSVEELLTLAGAEGWMKIGLVRPGCGNGQLQWSEVKPLLSPLDDRFILVNGY